MAKRLLLVALLLATAPASASPEPPWNGSTNCSGSIASGGTAQKLTLPQVLHGYQIQNLSTDVLAFSEFTVTPAAFTNGSWTLAPATGSAATSSPGGAYNSPGSYSPATPIYIIGATTGDKFTCSAW